MSILSKKKTSNLNIFLAISELFNVPLSKSKKLLKCFMIGKEKLDSLSTLDIFLRSNGYYSCSPYCCENKKSWTIKDFAEENYTGKYMLLVNNSVVPLIDGNCNHKNKNEHIIMYWRSE